MRRKTRPTLLYIIGTVLIFTALSLHLCKNVSRGEDIRSSPVTLTNFRHPYLAIGEVGNNRHLRIHVTTHVDQQSVSVLFPDWEALVVTSPVSSDSSDNYDCLFQNNATSPAIFAGNLVREGHTRVTFRCAIPNSVCRLRPLYNPVLTRTGSGSSYPGFGSDPNRDEMIRWSYLAYESLSTETDVIVFAKGVNNRQGVNLSPEELTCVFTNDVTNHVVKTAVTSSVQEVFRCHHPNGNDHERLFIGGEEVKVKISLELVYQKKVVPSLAYYAPMRSLGVDKFILYDNGSDDDLDKVIGKLVEEDYDVEKIFWPWPKTQEAGFSHSAASNRDTCKWMLYVDVDEFMFEPSWVNSSYPSPNMLKSLLPEPKQTSLLNPNNPSSTIGQVMIHCLEYGPSGQRSHPFKGVTQGYICRSRFEQRHKSILLLEAVDTSLVNVIHHFVLKEGYRGKRLSKDECLVNHYKYQAWSEFKTKFRRRVSAYVVDWRQEVNLKSKDRAPGLGFDPIEPKGWAQRFCEVRDTRLQVATQKWFGLGPATANKMVWQD
ncbi:hypothetical protein GIB67_003943 [Kingdonia uniflora]|uniref:Glycosyltransferase family 92 protein n=1 Tax=Kingdonia uniflora TaxID=39325 RepID=A0A7J7KY88_9MAGN|nr:hypothetical protein GIB67_003943 [Kingdonia uniflora]